MDRYAYGYLLGAVAYMGFWAFLFWSRPDLRRMMVVMSILSVLYGLPHEYFLWLRDWWHPPTITRTPVGVEDLLYAIGNGGVLATIYPFAFGLRLEPSAPQASPVVRLTPYAINGLLPPLLVALFAMHSFLASGAGALLAVLVILCLRPDLWRSAVGTALLGTLVSLPVYWVMEGLLPGFIATSWSLERLSGILLLGIPLEDLLWYIYTAALWGTYYPFWRASRLVRSPGKEKVMAREFVFVDEWDVQAPIEAVFEALADARTYPLWWKPVYRQVEADGPPAVGRVSYQLFKGRLPYQLRISSEIVRLDPPREMEIRVGGDLSGRGVWTLTPILGGVHIHFDWRVTADRFLLRVLSPLLRPLFRWNHNWCIRRAQEGMLPYLQNRSTGTGA